MLSTKRVQNGGYVFEWRSDPGFWELFGGKSGLTPVLGQLIGKKADGETRYESRCLPSGKVVAHSFIHRSCSELFRQD
jgi:hypothetical protein